MAQFIESFATQQLLPPFRSVGVTVTAFLFRLSTDVVQAYCDRFLNLGPAAKRPFHYMALRAAPIGLLSITQFPSIYTVLPAVDLGGLGLMERSWDNLTQNELFAAAPVLRYRVLPGGVLVDPTLEWVQPFLVLDNSTSAFSGREILGLETLWGTVNFSSNDAGGVVIDTSLPSWSVFSPTSQQQILPFLHIETGPPMTPDAVTAAVGDAVANPASMADVAALRAAIPGVDAVAGGLFPAAMRMVILKQFRDAGNAAKAIYQSLVTAQCNFSNVADVKLYAAESCAVQFTPGAMVNEIIGTLLDIPQAKLDQGLLTSEAAPEPEALEVRMGFSFTADINLDQIETIHDFAG